MDAIPHERFALGDLPLQNGGVLRAAELAYATYGTLAPDGANVIVIPTAYGGTHLDNEWMIGAEKTFDPAKWYVVSPNLFGAGLSTSPSRAHESQAGPDFPRIGIYDNIEAQHRLLVKLGVRRIALVCGFSMGGIQAFHWGAFAPGFVERIAPICGCARTAEHSQVFLESIEATLRTDPDFAEGHYVERPLAGQRAVGRVWAAWGFSQAFYRAKGWQGLGFASREAFVAETYEASFSSYDANDLLAMLHTWHSADIGSHPRYGGDTGAALRAIRARATILPCRTDLYFPPEDSALEVAAMPHARLAVIESIYGHAGGANVDPPDSAFIAETIAELLAS